MKIGTKSVLFGAHQFMIHPWFVALAWWKLYGFPRDPRLWVAFFVHDLGYIGKPNMDGEEGELHPYFAAWIMGALFDKEGCRCILCDTFSSDIPRSVIHAGEDYPEGTSYWHDFCLFHSRYLAKRLGGVPSRLCFADKLSFYYTPAWLYLPMVTATGEIREYLKNAQTADSGHWKPTGYDKKRWHAQLSEYMHKWVYEHMDGREDTWTSANRHARDASGVWQ